MQFGFKAAQIGKTVILNSEAVCDMGVRLNRGKVTNVAFDANGAVAMIYADFNGQMVSVNEAAVLTVV